MTGPDPTRSAGVVRMWEVRVRPGRTADYLRLLHETVLPALDGTDGMLGAEVFRPLDETGDGPPVGPPAGSLDPTAKGAPAGPPDPTAEGPPGGAGVDPGAGNGEDRAERIVLVTRWRDRTALAAAAGPRWRTAPVDRPDELVLQARPAHVWHFAPHG